MATLRKERANGKKRLEERIGKVKLDLGKRLDDWERITKLTNIELDSAEMDMSEAFTSGKADEGQRLVRAQTKESVKHKKKKQSRLEDRVEDTMWTLD